MRKAYTFREIVIRNEFRAISGARYRTITYLSGILALTFLCLGLSNKALEYQKILSSNPFANWINIEVTKSIQDSTLNMLNDLASPLLRKRFLIKNSYLSKGFGASFLDRQGKPTALPLPKARTINPESSIIHDLLNPGNSCKSYSSGFLFAEQPFGFIVTAGFLDRLGFNPDSIHYLSYGLYGGMWVPVPVLRVVRELPDHADVLCTDSFYIMKSYSYKDDPGFSRLFFEATDHAEVSKIKTLLNNKCGLQPDSIVVDDQRKLMILTFRQSQSQTPDFSDNRINAIYGVPELFRYHFGPWFSVIHDTSAYTRESYIKKKKNFNFDYLAIEFSRLDKLKEFSDFIRNRYLVSINMETVEQRQTFLFSLNISLGAILLVLFISGFSILLFLSNSLKHHLDIVSRNLGNFLAFGVERRIIIEIYCAVILKILVISMAAAFLVAYLVGELFEKYILQRVLILKSDQEFFSLINSWLVIFIVAVILISVGKTGLTVSNLVRKTPGDLIYERENRKREN